MIMSEDANGDGMFSKAIKVYTKRKFAYIVSREINLYYYYQPDVGRKISDRAGVCPLRCCN